MLFFQGYLIGISTTIFIGPVFFYLLKTTLEKDWKFGLTVALGIIVSDIVCAIICAIGAQTFLKNNTYQFWFALAGALILFSLGLKYIIKPVNSTNTSIALSNSKVSVFSQGFLINFVNPFVFMVWIGFIVYGENKTTDPIGLFLFVVAILLGIFSSDVVKVILANKIRPYLQPKYMLILYKVIGVILIIFSIRLFIWVV